MNKFVAELVRRYAALTTCAADIENAIDMISACFAGGNTLFLCGNGGSGADADHIAGELLKGFLLKREITPPELAALTERFGAEGATLGGKLQRGLRTVSLLSHPGFITAFCNDVDPAMIYAQQLYAQGRRGDVLLGISTSGNAENVRQAFMTAAFCGIKTILLTGAKSGKCVPYADLTSHAPETETYKIQELHLPIYHTMCMAIEDNFFGKK